MHSANSEWHYWLLASYIFLSSCNYGFQHLTNILISIVDISNLLLENNSQSGVDRCIGLYRNFVCDMHISPLDNAVAECETIQSRKRRRKRQVHHIIIYARPEKGLRERELAKIMHLLQSLLEDQEALSKKLRQDLAQERQLRFVAEAASEIATGQVRRSRCIVPSRCCCIVELNLSPLTANIIY